MANGKALGLNRRAHRQVRHTQKGPTAVNDERSMGTAWDLLHSAEAARSSARAADHFRGRSEPSPANRCRPPVRRSSRHVTEGEILQQSRSEGAGGGNGVISESRRIWRQAAGRTAAHNVGTLSPRGALRAALAGLLDISRLDWSPAQAESLPNQGCQGILRGSEGPEARPLNQSRQSRPACERMRAASLFGMCGNLYNLSPGSIRDETLAPSVPLFASPRRGPDLFRPCDEDRLCGRPSGRSRIRVWRHVGALCGDGGQRHDRLSHTRRGGRSAQVARRSRRHSIGRVRGRLPDPGGQGPSSPARSTAPPWWTATPRNRCAS